jgi:hypothetical protein
MEEPNRRRWLLFTIIGIVLVVAAICGFGYWFFRSGITTTSHPADPAIDRTELILEAVKDHPDEPPPDDLPSDMQFGAEQCWDMLQDAMAASHNQYTLEVVGVYGDYGTPTGHGATEIVVLVTFTDELQITMQYYNYTLEMCRQVTNEIQ